MTALATVQEWAHKYLDQGLAVFWLPEGSKVPPYGSHGFKDATRDHLEIARWPDRCNVAVAGGKPSGNLAVLDIDPRHGGDVSLESLEREHGRLPQTRTASPGGGGTHHHFVSSEPVPCSVGKIGTGIDLRGAGGYALLPPSIHPNGCSYRWVDEGELAALPESLERIALAAARPRGSRHADIEEHRHRASSDGPIRELPASIYVPLLTGRDLNRGGFVTCPFHTNGAERTPSLRAWEDPARGWFCFSCQVGGDIFTLAALVGRFEIPLHGRDFVLVRKGLERHLSGAIAS